MAALRPSWSRSCLRHLSPLRTAATDPPLKCTTGAVERRRSMATEAEAPDSSRIVYRPEAVARHQPLRSSLQGHPLPAHTSSSNCPLIGAVLDALQRKDVAATRTAFVAWTTLLAADDSLERDGALRAFDELPASTLSEIIRSVDPIRHPELDVSYGMNLTLGHVRFMPSGELMDEFGVRVHHYQVMEGMRTIMALREHSPSPLLAADFDAFLRSAGASQNVNMAPIFFGYMKQYHLTDRRTSRTWAEFLKARFMTEPAYFQYDRARVNVTVRDIVQSRQLLEEGTVFENLMRMERLRMSSSVLKREPWNRVRDELSEDIKRLLRRSKDKQYKTFWSHLVRTMVHPHEMDEELACISLVALARSNHREAIFDMILKPYYGITLDSDGNIDEGTLVVPEGSSLRPTPRLIHAVIEAFGTMADMSLGMQLADILSRRYNVPITHKAWSNILQWTYLTASKSYRSLWKLVESRDDKPLRPVFWNDLMHVWKIMTSPPYNIVPSFEDFDLFVKTHIVSRNIGPAIEYIRSTAIPYYRSVDQEYKDALLEEILFNDAKSEHNNVGSGEWTAEHSSSSQHFTQRRKEAEVRKDFVFNRIASWFDDLQRSVSSSRRQRNGDTTRSLIPDLVRDFPEFFVTGVYCRTSVGTMEIKEPFESAPLRWDPSSFKNGRVVPTIRQVMPVKVGSARLHAMKEDKQGNPRQKIDESTGLPVENPDFQWRMFPEKRPVNVVEFLRKPRRRTEFGRPPNEFDDPKEVKKWWAALETEMKL